MGHLSLPLLQGMILISIYELGHAIYPAAYMSIGNCVRLGLALELEKQCQSDLDLTSYDLEEQEERRRTWWAIFTLDRVHIQSRPTSPDPRPADLLPVDDQDWDDGVINPNQCQTVSSPSSSSMGMLARLAQAAYLHGKVLRHKREPTSDADFNQHERLQIDRSLRALLRLAYEGNSVPVTTICPQTAMCFGALVELHSPDLSEAADVATVNWQAKTKSKQEALNLLRPVASQAYHESGVWFRNRPFTLSQATPLLLPWTYQAAVMFLQLSHWFQMIKLLHGKSDLGRLSEENEQCIIEANRGVASMMRKLSLLGGQWRAADAYLQILEARITSNIV
ncbi:Fungal specific transcription factor domain-containing protein [Cladophialophora immunda]|nr:Fungal specific transcription factor domain-containing protein [Cladophialophora immunda]